MYILDWNIGIALNSVLCRGLGVVLSTDLTWLACLELCIRHERECIDLMKLFEYI